MAKVTFDILMTKIANIFKNDIYIINNQYILGGNESEEKNITQIVCKLNLEFIEILNEIFPDINYAYIKSVKEVRTDLDKFSSTKIFETEKRDLDKRLNNVMKFVDKTSTWKNFDFNEETANSVFKDGETIELFSENKDIPSITISKTLFPLMNEKKIDTLYYHVHLPEMSDDLINLITCYDTEWFQIYNLIQYIDAE